MVIAFMSLYLTKELHFTMARAGLVMGAYGLGSIIGSYVGGWITDRKNVHSILVVSLALSGMILLPLLFITDFYLITALIFVYSLVADSFRPANNVAIARFSNDTTRTRSFSLMRLAINLGFGIGPAIGGIAAVTIGFKWIFLIDSVSSILAAIVIGTYLPKKELDVVRKTETDEKKTSASVFADRMFLAFLALVVVYGTCLFQLFASVPLYFSRTFHYSEDVIGYLLALNGLIVVVLEMPIIYNLESRKNVYRFISVGCIAMVLAYLMLWAGNPSLWLSVLYTLFITLAEILAMPFMMNFVFAKAPASKQGQYSAMYAVAYGVAHIAAPSLGLKLAEQAGFGVLYLVAAAISLSLAGAFWFLFKKVNPAIQTSTETTKAAV